MAHEERQDRKIPFWIVLAFGINVVSLVSCGFFMVVEVNNQQDKMQHIMKSYEIINNASELIKALVDQETGERGFLIVGREVFLEPFDFGRDAFQNRLKALKKMVNDKPDQLQRIAEILRHAQLWHQKAAIPEIAARNRVNQGEVAFSTVVAMVDSATGKSIMDRLRGMIDDFIASEQRQVTQYRLQLEYAAKNIFTLSLGAVLFITLIGAGTFFKAIKSLK